MKMPTSRMLGKFPQGSDRVFQLIYIPGAKEDASLDECYVEYYWQDLRHFGAEPGKADIAGLPDLSDALFVVRLETLSQYKYWQGGPPYTLSVLRMRVDSQELTLTSENLGAPVLQNGLLIYRKPLPKEFRSTLDLFQTIDR